MLRAFADGMGAEAFLYRGWRQVEAKSQRENFATAAASGVSRTYEAGGGGCGLVGGFVGFSSGVYLGTSGSCMRTTGRCSPEG
jgi:hypothetical protein